MAREIVEMYHDAGFSGIAITDHMHSNMVKRFSNDWNRAVDNFLRGYKKAKERGEALGLSVILGMEIRFDSGYGDYLVYGIDEEFLLSNPFLPKLGIRKFFNRFKQELLIIQAHPFRENDKVHDRLIHGLEVYNGNPRHSNRNKKAMALYEAKPRLLPFCASDAHEIEDIAGGWLELSKPVSDSFQFRDLVLQREYQLGKE